jgi:3-oxoacyl-[acyl-carrier-protein] synthase II
VKNRRVVITGMGWVTPLGVQIEDAWQRLIAGRSGVAEITIFDASNFPVRIAAEVKNWSIEALSDDALLSQALPGLSGHARQTQFTVVAALRAAEAAGLSNLSMDPALMGICLGNGEIMPDFNQLAIAASGALVGEDWDANLFVQHYLKTVPHDIEVMLDPSAPLPLIAGLLDAAGPCCNITNACVSSAAAIGRAAGTIKSGDADVMIAGGGHSMIHPFGVTGFHRLSTLSLRNDEPAKAARPFDRDREGFVVGEGAAIIILEELEHAQRRGADAIVELAGFAANHDAYRVTDPRSDGLRAAKCIELALADAECAPTEIDYINAHGSGTIANDRAETLAIKRCLGTHAAAVPMSSTKSMVGHLTTACGALEAVISALTIRDGVVPPTINYETPDPECDLDYVPNEARKVACRRVLSTNFGFGGQNVALVFAAMP